MEDPTEQHASGGKPFVKQVVDKTVTGREALVTTHRSVPFHYNHATKNWWIQQILFQTSENLAKYLHRWTLEHECETCALHIASDGPAVALGTGAARRVHRGLDGGVPP